MRCRGHAVGNADDQRRCLCRLTGGVVTLQDALTHEQGVLLLRRGATDLSIANACFQGAFLVFFVVPERAPVMAPNNNVRHLRVTPFFPVVVSSQRSSSVRPLSISIAATTTITTAVRPV